MSAFIGHGKNMECGGLGRGKREQWRGDCEERSEAGRKKKGDELVRGFFLEVQKRGRVRASRAHYLISFAEGLREGAI